MRSTIRFVLVAAALILGALLPASSSAFVTNGVTWPQIPVPYFINPTNLDGLSGSAIDTAIQTGANSWQLQSGANFRFAFSGESAQTTTTFDSINLVVFRNASNGSAIATTYTWMSGSSIVDADIVFWDGGFKFFTGNTGCSGGFYVEDIAAHEFGHALGLGHSTAPTATMYPSTGPCNLNPRSLDADDIAGVQSLYPPITNAAPAPPSRLRIVGGL